MYWDFERESIIRDVRQESTHLYDDTTTISAFGVVDPNPGHATDASPTPDSRHEHQSKIPRLPVPPLAETCGLYLSSLEGVVNAEEYAATEEKVREFLEPGGAGERLQRLLEEREARQEQPSWLEEWWDDAYLVTRDPIPININYFFGFRAHPDPAVTQVGRAASLLHAALEFYVQVRDGTLTNDMERTTPLCMSQMRRVFAASRIPGPTRDSIVSYSTAPLTADERASKTCQYVATSPAHCVVLVRNRFYRLRVLQKPSGDVLPVELLTAAIARVAEAATSANSAPGPPVGLLTTMHRGDWAEAYAQLVELGNGDVLQQLHSAIMVLCLDGMAVGDTAEAARLFLHGTGTNRWFDRHNLIVSRNAAAGINFEHSVGDGATTLRVADFMFRQDARRGPVDVAACTAAHGTEAADLVTEMHWRLDSSVDRVLKSAFTDFLQLIESNETTVLHFRHFGGNMIKNAKLSPDAFVQLAFQLTYYRLFGRNDATYEAASTRAFLHGRTETVRSATRAAAEFCKAVTKRGDGDDVVVLRNLLRTAVQEHIKRMQRSKRGCGIDRHFFGLRCLALVDRDERPMPRLFQDKVFCDSCHWNISTSHCGSKALTQFGFGPVVLDGFGLGYMIFNDDLHVVVTCKRPSYLASTHPSLYHRNRSSVLFAATLESSLLRMGTIVEGHGPSAPQTVKSSL
jgi:carnitine O-acetyltransferase